MQGDEISGAPPGPRRTARRALVLAGLSWRAFFEEVEPRDPEWFHSGIAWLARDDLRAEAEPDEARLLGAPRGSWTDRDRINASWGIEAAAVLAWALRLYALPAHDAEVDPQHVADALGLFAEAPSALGASALRPREELGWMEERLFHLHWRLRALTVTSGPLDFTRILEDGTARSEAAAVAFAGRDLAVGGAPTATAPQEAVLIAGSIALERHHAIAWLVGDTPLWSEVDTST